MNDGSGKVGISRLLTFEHKENSFRWRFTWVKEETDNYTITADVEGFVGVADQAVDWTAGAFLRFHTMVPAGSGFLPEFGLVASRIEAGCSFIHLCFVSVLRVSMDKRSEFVWFGFSRYCCLIVLFGLMTSAMSGSVKEESVMVGRGIFDNIIE